MASNYQRYLDGVKDELHLFATWPIHVSINPDEVGYFKDGCFKRHIACGVRQ